MTAAALAPRIAALMIALAALGGMIVPLQSAAGNHGSWLAGLWALLRFFTILTNALVAAVFLPIAVRGPSAIGPRLLGAVVLAIMLVGAVFNLLLGQPAGMTPAARFADDLHHIATPLAVPLWWLVFARHGQLDWRAPLLWALYPLAYSAYILTRAALTPPAAEPVIPYFFMDVGRLGWSAALANMAMISAAFVLAGLAFVWLDRALAPRG